MNLYEINDETLAIVPVDVDNSIVYEKDDVYEIKQNSFKIMDFSCQYFGSSYVGRKDGSKNILGIGYKVPIVVEDTKNIIFFPTESPLLESCIWLSLKNIKSYEKNGHKTKVTFKNNQQIDIDCSFKSIQNQIYRAARLESVLRDRKKI